ncbi:hypothetical protein GLX27_000402 [Malassezia furfur]|uniref:DOC domain-containing protein n=1 Tax=Malassezia furfur TaxID=55194 RepID=A0ABY8EJ73_MALFU|nr:hypothetical protein GLX27_000402 [Malassezia furfur]
MSLDPYDHTSKTDVGSIEGTTWALSSAKARHGVAQLMDDDLNTLWQSEGSQPHTVTIHFPKRTKVTHVSVYLDCRRDDSYTPTKILVKAGTHPYDLVEVRYRDFVEPQGWYHFVLDKPDPDVPEEQSATFPLEPIEVFVLQVCILSNHLNGKDTHIRGMKVFGPPAPGMMPTAPPASSKAPVERLVQQGMRTEAFRRQVARVGFDRAAAQLERIMQQHTHSPAGPAVPARVPARHSALTNTLR